MRYYKITDKDLEEKNVEEIIQCLEKRNQTLIKYDINLSGYNALEAMKDCESPIERQLAYSLYSYRLDSCYLYNPKIDILDMKKQEVIHCGHKKYRVDFAIYVLYPLKEEQKTFIVECDGHEFHEKTKEQVAYNNKKVRDLLSYGYEVIKFSGSEIFKNSGQCAREIIKIIVNYAEK